ncbi:hypothetical protein StrepF001_25665 [Streptomyces sp. F001]|uniref:hypothetical protein n=1 Tax=Streptomyces sp. F001 TaxID=1510026 RepID=UPI00101E4FED|nr:hypothetical protein [Streptomyces sp. F001]RZB16668.1 hypothetical protein StrepF001_25665 [Streptomyces sp. F001]
MRDDTTDRHDAAAWSPLDSDGWYAARNATTALRDALIRAEMEKDFPYLRADLNAFGHGLVELGRVSPTTAERLAELLRLALASGLQRLEESSKASTEHRAGED